MQFCAVRLALGYRNSTSINVKHANLLLELELKCCFASICKCFASPNSVALESLYYLRSESIMRNQKIKILTQFSLFNYFIRLEYSSKIMYRSQFPPGMVREFALNFYFPNIDISLAKIKEKDNRNVSVLHMLDLWKRILLKTQ